MTNLCRTPLAHRRRSSLSISANIRDEYSTKLRRRDFVATHRQSIASSLHRIQLKWSVSWLFDPLRLDTPSPFLSAHFAFAQPPRHLFALWVVRAANGTDNKLKFTFFDCKPKKTYHFVIVTKNDWNGTVCCFYFNSRLTKNMNDSSRSNFLQNLLEQFRQQIMNVSSLRLMSSQSQTHTSQAQRPEHRTHSLRFR